MVAAESHVNALDGVVGPREPWRELSSLPTDDERMLFVVSSRLSVNAKHVRYRDPVPGNSHDK